MIYMYVHVYMYIYVCVRSRKYPDAPLGPPATFMDFDTYIYINIYMDIYICHSFSMARF